MLRRNMPTASLTLQLSLEDLLGELQHARRQDDMSRLALLAYCEVRRWARQAGETELAEQSTALVTRTPQATREQFVADVDALITRLEQTHQRLFGHACVAAA